MRRALTILLAASASTLAFTQSASAATLNLTPYMEVAVTDNFVYWVKQTPSGCKRCNQLWRTSLSDGSALPVLAARKGRISDLTANGQTIAFTESRRLGRRYLTTVRMLTESGAQRTVASAAYRPHARQNCGELVGAGAVSRSGELAWQKISTPKPGWDCYAVDANVRWRAFASSIHSTDRILWGPQNQSAELLNFDELLSQARPITGFDGVRVLVAPDSRGPAGLDVATGIRTDFMPDETSDYSSGARLTATGGVAAFRYREVDDGWIPILFPTFASNRNPVDIPIPEADGMSLEICGSELIQLAQDKRGIVLARHDPTGRLIATSRVEMPKTLSYPWFKCNGGTAVVFYTLQNKQNRILKAGAFSTPLP